MKKIFLLILILGIGTVQRSNAQCVASIVNVPSTCDSLCSGFISMQFSGGQMPLTLNLSINGVPVSPFTVTTFWQWGNLCPGDILDFLIIDAAGDTCTGPGPIQVLNLPGPNATVNVTNASCAGCNDGSATVNVTGGTPPYTYYWSIGANTQSVTGLLPGSYTVNVIDANGCTDMDSVLIGVGASGYYALSGQIYFDLNSNGIKDIGETGIGNLGVELQPGNISALTNMQGNYAFVIPPGSFDVSYIGAPGWNLTSTPDTHSVVVSNSSIGGLDFGVYPDSTAGSAAISLNSGWPRCFWDVPYYITVYNSGFTILSGAITFTYDPLLTFVSSGIPPVSHIGNILTYTYTNLAPGQSLGIIVTLTEPAGGMAISSNLAVTGTDAFGYQFALNSTLAQIVNCSYDPNDKNVLPEGYGVNHYVTMDTWLEYMIRFQNTGNDTAFRVVVLDTIDNGLDLATFSLLNSSHPVDVTMRSGNEVTFTFENILLPDSNVNEPGSHGYILYRIKGLGSNPDPTVINNTAYIYFDLNSPVITNTTLTTLSDNFLSAGEIYAGNNFELYPNPAFDSFTLRLKENSQVEYAINLFDMIGAKISGPIPMRNGQIMINCSHLSPGTYIIEAIPQSNGNPVRIPLLKK